MAHQTSFVEFNQKKVQLTRGGQGPPLLYLHSAAGETEWGPFQELLARQFTVYQPAHPGFALSTGLEVIRDMADLTWHYVDLMQALELPRLPVIGFSLGAWLAAELAILRPQLFNRLVMVAAAGLHVPAVPMGEIFIDDLEKLRSLLFFDPKSEPAQKFLPHSREDERILLWLRAREATARVGWNPYLHNPRLPAHLHRIEVPTLLIWGDRDRVIPVEHGNFYARHIPGAKLDVIANCGHMVPIEFPDKLAPRCVEFLT